MAFPVSYALLLVFALSVRGHPQETAPLVPGLRASHPLPQASVGKLLLAELRCAACHTGPGLDQPPVAAPDLREVGARVAPDYLQRFLADPGGTHPGSQMPDLLHRLAAGERTEVARALTHFLVERSGEEEAPPRVASADLEAADLARGEELYHTVGCVACHAPRRPPDQHGRTPAARAGAVDLEHVRAKYGLDSLTAFLFQPLHARPAGRMPDLWLTREESRQLAGYLIGPDAPPRSSLPARPEFAAAGRRHFAELNCAACHPLDEVRPGPRIPIVGGPDREPGCLAPEPGDAPRYRLDAAQRAAITTALEAPAGAESDRTRIARTFAAQQCSACHERDGHGGVRRELDPYFVTDEHDLGDDARIPPSLTLVGAKLQGDWLRTVLFENGNLRDYMFTRMPRFGQANLAHLPELFERVDAGKLEPFEMPLPTGEEARVARDAGRELTGIRGLGCIACHDFNGTPSPTHEGIDLVNSPERLTPSWFARFLIEPQTYRPGVVMPESWSGGVASHPDILGGDTEAQIRALWFYLSEGRTARDPEGIQPVRSRLTVEAETLTYRGRSSVAGYRGIAVGFPGGLSYAFNAQTGTLSALWRGDFVSVRWDGQGAGGFDPVGRPVTLAQDVSFYRLPDAETPWPLRPRTTEENPVNPDPLYPRNHGYRFLGYSLDQDAVPTFRYACGDVTIEDRSVTRSRGERLILRRTLRFSPPTTGPLHFRVLTGAFDALSARAFLAPPLRVTIPDVPTVLRTSQEEDRPTELLLALPAGSTSLRIDYELLD